MTPTLPFKISVLIFVHDSVGRQLLILRNKAPNRGCWSPCGGKLEMGIGESPFECAVRELREETGHIAAISDLHLFATISEKNFEGDGHWLMFLFDCKKPLDRVPPSMDEGRFQFFTRADIEKIPVPPTDRTLVWPFFDEVRGGFVALRADCNPAHPPLICVDQRIAPPKDRT